MKKKRIFSAVLVTVLTICFLPLLLCQRQCVASAALYNADEL